MPELPEVETVVRDLRPLLIGRSVVAVRAGAKKLRTPWRKAWSAKLTGAAVEGIRRRGKWIVVDLGTGSRLVVHLGMSGQLTVTTADAVVPNHLHLRFDLDDGRQLRFRDPRRFGSVALFADEVAVQKHLADRLGPEPGDLDVDAFRDAVRGTTRPLKAILLDQTVVAGVGNIYADEALHRSGLHPERRGKTVASTEADRLREAILAVITAAIRSGGATFDGMYVGGTGQPGRFQSEFRVYGRTGKPCPTCESVIAVVRVAGRSSHYCPRCQPRRSLPRSGRRP